MVGLDLSKADQTLIQYTRFLCSFLDISHIYFLHVEKTLEWEGLEEEMDIREPKDESLQQRMADSIRDMFAGTEIEVDIEVVEGDPARELLHWAKIKQVDLVVIGKKVDEDGTGVVPDLMARKAPCSVLIVTSNAPIKLDRIVIPIDFSKYSEMALEEVAAFKRRAPGIVLMGHMVSRVPVGYYKTGKSHEEFEQIMRGNLQKKFDDFIATHRAEGLQIKPIITIEDKKSIGETIHDIAKEHHADLIIIGAKGHSAASVLLLGSVTERMIRRDKHIPILILKKKGETLGFLEALLRV
jgi:nucleotide-binding universal stress UspA family protein